MQTLALTLLAALTLTAAGLVHLRLVDVAGHGGSLWLTRALLALAGIGFGWAMLRYAAIAPEPPDTLDRLLIFAGAFGLVHVPAWFILLLKRLRRRQE